VSKVQLFHVSAERNPVAVLWYEPRRPRGVSLIAGHGYSSSKHNLDFLCSFLASHGFGVYSLDFPGHKLGASGGELRGIDDCIDVMFRVVAFARERGDDASYTLGHSMGGMTAVFTAALDPNILGTLAIATGYGRPTSLEALRKVGVSDFRSSYVVGVTLPELVAGIESRYAELLPRLAGRPALYVAASRDARSLRSCART
jgi:alpha-beta hydrolase superfamily lysophospholipase